MRTKSILFTVAFFCLSMTAFAHIYDTDIKWKTTTDDEGKKTVQIEVTGDSVINATGTYSVSETGAGSYNYWGFNERRTITIAPGDGQLLFRASFDAPHVSDLSVSIDMQTGEATVYRSPGDWHIVHVTSHIIDGDTWNKAVIDVTTGGSNTVGGPLPAPVVTLLIALAFGGAFVLYRNRKQAKA